MFRGVSGLCPQIGWRKIRKDLLAEVKSIAMGGRTDLSNFVGVAIDDQAFAKHKRAINRAKRSSKLEVLVGGQTDDKVGYFVRPTVIEAGG